jgi:hypothetical protein
LPTKSTPEITTTNGSSLVAKYAKLSSKCRKTKQQSIMCCNKHSEQSVIKYKYRCEHKLIEFIKQQYLRIWGETDWKLMLEINVDSATLRDMIRLLHKQWFNFSDYFERSITVKTLIDKLHIRLCEESRVNINHNELYYDLKSLMSEISSRNK